MLVVALAIPVVVVLPNAVLHGRAVEWVVDLVFISKIIIAEIAVMTVITVVHIMIITAIMIEIVVAAWAAVIFQVVEATEVTTVFNIITS